jgi:hypothetical protein
LKQGVGDFANQVEGGQKTISTVMIDQGQHDKNADRVVQDVPKPMVELEEIEDGRVQEKVREPISEHPNSHDTVPLQRT